MMDAGSMRASVRWIDEADGESYVTLANLSVWLDDQPAWPVWGDSATDLDVFADDLLMFLTLNWSRLLLDRDYPSRLEPAAPSHLWAMAEAVASGGSQTAADGLFESVRDFEGAHELSRSIGGQFGLPQLWMVRRGDGMLVETGGRSVLVPLDAWLDFATELGRTVAERLRERAGGKYERLVAAWDRRDEGDAIALLSLSIGQSREVSEGLVRDGLLTPEPTVSGAANDNDVLRVAARMVGAAPYAQIKAILSEVAGIASSPSSELDAMAAAVRDQLFSMSAGSPPHEQGKFAAQALRSLLGIPAGRPADPLAALERLQVPVHAKSLQLATLDALAVWGECNGPAVVLNKDSRRFAGNRANLWSRPAFRATVAHEICHLLLDRDRSLAAVDILNGRMPQDAEKRAGAFAAEFLLPEREAAELWRRSELPTSLVGVSTMLGRLADRYLVSRQMAAWQLDHGLQSLDPEVLFWLDELIPQRRDRFGGH